MPADALSGRLDGGCIYARGTSDCKGGLTVGVSAIRALLGSGAPLRGSIIFQSVVDEECNGGGAGTLACLEAGYRGDVAVFVDGNAGTLTMGCGGLPHGRTSSSRGRRGMPPSAPVSPRSRRDWWSSGAWTPSRPSARGIAPTAASTSGSSIRGCIRRLSPAPPACPSTLSTKSARRRTSREQTGVYGGPQIREVFERTIREAEAGDEWLSARPSRIEWVKDLIPYEQSPLQPEVLRFDQAFRAATGRPPVYDKMVAWSDAAHPAALHNITTILYGPGVAGTAHSSCEYVSVANLVECTKVLATYLLSELGA